MKPRTPALSKPSSSKIDADRIPKGDNAVSIDDVTTDDDRKKNNYHFDRHTPEYRLQFEKITEEMQSRCPIAWTDVYNGHWVAADSKHVFELAAARSSRTITTSAARPPSRASRFRRPAVRPSSAAASWRWTSRSTAPTAVR
ncbi:cytochrome P450 [Mycolicibacterium fortuitum]|uniref:Cytochrome P450 n=1 Tax=Mycolicibacterium fortuitum TaxID=1766 RepID=A0A378UVE4_MYCFO|nr:cytochrome P450 [Mycolicibacterium fortuitum]